jgi:uncharacterized protein YbbC (DUF1343 family)
VTDRGEFHPVLAAVAVLQESSHLGEGKFRWNPPPYEYETEKLPIDILSGNDWLRLAIEGFEPLSEIAQRMDSEVKAFAPIRNEALLYL